MIKQPGNALVMARWAPDGFWEVTQAGENAARHRSWLQLGTVRFPSGEVALSLIAGPLSVTVGWVSERAVGAPSSDATQ